MKGIPPIRSPEAGDGASPAKSTPPVASVEAAAELRAANAPKLRAANAPNMDDCAVDGSHVQALKGGDHVGPSPVDRGRLGSKHHVIVGSQGIPLAVSLTGGNRHDVTQLITLLDPIPRIGGLRGRPRNRPKRMFADRGYDFDKYRRLLCKRGIKPLIVGRGVAHGAAFAWLHPFKRLRIRFERRADLHHGLLQLACCIICLRRLQAQKDQQGRRCT